MTGPQKLHLTDDSTAEDLSGVEQVEYDQPQQQDDAEGDDDADR